MKFKSLLLLAGSFLIVEVAPSISAPVQVISQQRSPSLLAATNPGQACNTMKAAVVTIYAGTEIGSGSIVSPDGLVITNNHVVKQIVRSGGSKPIYVKLANGERYTANLLKTNATRDLALVKLNAQEQLPSIPLSDTNEVKPGQPVCAIGSPYGRAGVVTQGSVSLIRRNGDVQSKLVLQPGNSGGPLINAQGEMIGVNRAILESAGGKNTGISIAISARAARDFIEQSGFQVAGNSVYRAPTAAPETPTIASPVPGNDRFNNPVTKPSIVANRKSASKSSTVEIPVPTITPATPSSRRLGMKIDKRILVVRQVEAGSPAASSGLQPGDQLVAINNQQVTGFEDLQAFLNSQSSSAQFTVRRDRQLIRLQVNF